MRRQNPQPPSSESYLSLIDVVRRLTTSPSLDQKEAEKARLEALYKKSANDVDELLDRHQTDVTSSLKTFRAVSAQVTSCRQRIRSIKNALEASKTLLQNRRDALKDLWIENVQQKYVCEILDKIGRIKQMDVIFNEHLQKQRYREAIDVVKKADIDLNGQLSAIDGLSELRNHVVSLTGRLFETIVSDLVDLLAVRPFETQMIELLKGAPSDLVEGSELCQRLSNKYHDDEASINATVLSEVSASVLRPRIHECLAALAVFDQVVSALNQVFLLSKSVYAKAISDTVTLLNLISKKPVDDVALFAQVVQIAVLQINRASEAHNILASELSKVGRYDQDINVLVKFWSVTQEVLRTLVVKHLDFFETDVAVTSEAKQPQTRVLFRFEGTSCVSSVTKRSREPIPTICNPDPYNIIPIFRVLSVLGRSIEQQYKLSQFNDFLHTFVMSTFIDRVKKDLDAKTQNSLSRPDVWMALSSTTAHTVRLLVSCLSILDVCKEVSHLMHSMEQYTQQFAYIWLSTLNSYRLSAAVAFNAVSNLASPTELSLVMPSATATGTAPADAGVRKTSAVWAEDESVRSVVRSLAKLQLVTITDADTTPTGDGGSLTPGTGPETNRQTIEANIDLEVSRLVAHLGGRKQLERSEIITEMVSIETLARMHESLAWFTARLRNMLSELPKRAEDILKTAPVSISGNYEKKLIRALRDEIEQLDSLAESCFLLIHLELRVHCFHYLMPLAQFRDPPPDDDIDKGVVEFGKDLTRFHQALCAHMVPAKVRHLFNGLGNLCAAIFIHSSQHMLKLTEANKKRVIRNIAGVQQHLCRLTGQRESKLDRAKQFYELLNKSSTQLTKMVLGRGTGFTFEEESFLVSLAIKSDPSLDKPKYTLDTMIAQLREKHGVNK